MQNHPAVLPLKIVVCEAPISIEELLKRNATISLWMLLKNHETQTPKVLVFNLTASTICFDVRMADSAYRQFEQPARGTGMAGSAGTGMERNGRSAAANLPAQPFRSSTAARPETGTWKSTAAYQTPFNTGFKRLLARTNLDDADWIPQPT